MEVENLAYTNLKMLVCFGFRYFKVKERASHIYVYMYLFSQCYPFKAEKFCVVYVDVSLVSQISPLGHYTY